MSDVAEPAKEVAAAQSRFRLLKSLGSGGYATVWAADDSKTKRPVILKIGNLSVQKEQEDIEKEGQLLGQLTHPHIATVYDIAKVQYPYSLNKELRPAIVMAFQIFDEMTTLGIKAEIERGMNPEEVVTYISQIASALDYMHKKGIFHRDLKPEAIVIDKVNDTEPPQLWATLIDFGLAIHDAKELKKSTGVIGTPSYMAPEIATKKSTGDRRSDTYSLAICALEALTGKRLLTGEDPAEIMEKAAYFVPPENFDFPKLSDELGAKLSKVFVKALAKDPDDRYQSAGELARDLQVAIYF